MHTFAFPLAPLLHGAAGPYDELINLIPLVVGGALLLYLYRISKRREAKEKPAAVDEGAGEVHKE